MLFREDFGIRMGSCILRMNGMMLFMGSMMIIRDCRGVEGIVGNRWTRLDLGDGLKRPSILFLFFFSKECLRLFSGSSARLVEGVEFECSRLILR